MNGIENLVPLIANAGFPVVISLYLLVRIEGKLDELSACIKELSGNLSRML
jgi:hypothetical protein